MGLYAHHTRGTGTVLTGSWSGNVVNTPTEDLFNGDHQNHVIHTDPTFVNSWEDTQAHMDRETDPAPGGVLSTAAAMSDELERIRFALTTIKKVISGGTPPAHWYTPLSGFTAFVALPPTACKQNIALSAIPTSANSDSPPTFLGLLQPAIYDTTGHMAGTAAMAALVTGVYIVGVNVIFDNVLSQDLQLTIVREPDGARLVTNQHFTGAVSAQKALTVETVAQFTAGQSMFFGVVQTSGSPQAPTAGTVWAALVSR